MLFRVILSTLVIFIAFQTPAVFGDEIIDTLNELREKARKVDDKEVDEKLRKAEEVCVNDRIDQPTQPGPAVIPQNPGNAGNPGNPGHSVNGPSGGTPPTAIPATGRPMEDR